MKTLIELKIEEHSATQWGYKSHKVYINGEMVCHYTARKRAVEAALKELTKLLPRTEFICFSTPKKKHPRR
jgi:hypothetical protein